MTLVEQHHDAAQGTRRTRLALVDRGDALVPYLSRALRQRFDVVAEDDVDLTRPERLLVAATTFRRRRHDWVERFFKSNLAVGLRSRRAAAALARTEHPFDLVFQTHALFEVTGPGTVLYVDCTHQQALAEWPEWNPLGPSGLARWLRRERRQYRAAAHVFAFSQRARDSLVDDYDVRPERVTVVGAGVNFDRLPVLSRERSDRDEGPADPGSRLGRHTILFVGHDFARKGGPELVEAFALLRRMLPDARLLVVGERPVGVDAPGVELLGRVGDRDRMSEIYAEADVFCLPSHFDPFGLVLLEAMAHGLPCVVTPTGGIPEIVEDGVTGLTVPQGPSLPISLVGALAQLLQDDALAERMGRAGRERVEQRFLWRHVVDRMAPELDRLGRTSTPSVPRPRDGAGR